VPAVSRPLLQHYPALADALPLIELASLPTPLERAADAEAGFEAGELWIKRDDLSGERYGGNKVRKLEFLLADAQARGCDAVLTYGAVGSNHALATAIYAHQLGLKCYAVLTPQPPTAKVARTLRYQMRLGTRLHTAANLQAIRKVTDEILEDHPTGARRVYQIPFGGSSWLGTVGFVNAAFELAEQIGDQPPPDFVYAATGTMGTTIGLAIGFRLLGWPTKVMGVRVVPQPIMTPEYFERLWQETSEELSARDPGIPRLPDPFENVVGRDGFLGEGYAIPTEATHEAVRLADELIGIGLETTYTGKAMAGLIHDARAGDLADRRTVFWQTYNSRPYPELDGVEAELDPELEAYLEA
jgi:1-aminocyclopropane-1-carboxylate deaminase/D-cysteine desulfhydrase-like pyridoxal-dependent ACC family enzyme